MRNVSIVLLLSATFIVGCSSVKTITPAFETSNENLEQLKRGEYVVSGQEVIPGRSEKPSNNLELNLDIPDWAKLIEQENYIIVRIEDDRLFDFEQETFSEKSDVRLEKLASAFSVLPEQSSIKIESHTGDRADDTFNLQLTKNRAESLLTYYEEQDELSHLSIEAEGLGEGKPIVPNTNEENQYINSRIDFIVQVPSKE